MDRLWAKVEKHGPDDCWPWIASTVKGYGQISIGGRCRRVSRVLVAEKEGLDLYDNSWVARHSCNNPPCCNPAHLFSGTVQDNVADRVAAGRTVWGDPHHLTKLTDEQVQDVRRRRADGESAAALAEAYGVHVETIRRYVRGGGRVSLTSAYS